MVQGRSPVLRVGKEYPIILKHSKIKKEMTITIELPNGETQVISIPMKTFIRRMEIDEQLVKQAYKNQRKKIGR